MELNKPRGSNRFDVTVRRPMTIWNLKASSLINPDIPSVLVDSESEMGMDLTMLSYSVTSNVFENHFFNFKPAV